MKNVIHKHFYTLVLMLLTSFLNAQTIETILHIPFDTIGGIKTRLDQVYPSGVAAYTIVNNHTVALLCDAENVVKVYDINTDNKILEFSLGKHSGNYISYDTVNSQYYIMDYREVSIYFADGTYDSTIPFIQNTYPTKIIIDNNNVYLHCGRSYFKIVENGRTLDLDEQKQSIQNRIIINDPDFTWKMISKRENGFGKYTLTHNGITTEYAIPLKDNTSKGFVPLGIIDDTIVFRERFSNADYNLVFYSMLEKRIVSDIEIPTIYYTVLHNRNKIFNKQLYQMLSTPDGIYLFLINHSNIKLKSTEIEHSSYPNNLNYRYHFNNHKNAKLKIQSIKDTSSLILKKQETPVATIAHIS